MTFTVILSFGVSNHLSIGDRQELLFSASTLKDLPDGLIECAAAPRRLVVPAIVIYGANASGKTNLINSFRAMSELVVESHNRGTPGGGVPNRRPFALDPSFSAAPTQFDIDFALEGVRHHYGFRASDDAFVSEWLYTFPKSHRRMLFEREGTHFQFGRSLGGANSAIAGFARPNSLFLSTAAQNGHARLSDVFAFFRSIRGLSGSAIGGDAASIYFNETEPDERVISFLRQSGTGVIDFRRKENKLPDNLQTFKREVEQAAERTLGVGLDLSSGASGRSITIELAHRGRDGKPVFFEIERESEGTRRLLVMLGIVFEALDAGALICIDELDASLHTHAAEAVLKLFCSPHTNPKGAQLVATTHDTNLLNSPVLRRDQVWLTEKDANGATQLYPLTDIRTRKGDNFEKGYLQGRFGGVPPNNPDLASGTTGQV